MNSAAEWNNSRFADYDGKPGCMLCSDQGINRHCGPYAFCGCPAGAERRRLEPAYCEQANATDQKLTEKFPSQGGLF